MGLVVGLLPPGRREWGQAMRAEFAAVEPGPGRWTFATSCLRAALWPGQLARAARYLVVVTAAVVLALANGTAGAMRVGVIGLGVFVPVALSWLGRQDALVGAVGPSPMARVARRLYLTVLAGCLVVGIETIAVTLPRYGGASTSAGAATGLTLLCVFLALYLALGFAATSAVQQVPAVTLVAGGVFGAAAGLAWCVLLPFDQTLSTPGAGWTAGYAVALAAVVVGLPATAAVLCVRRSGDRRQGVFAGAATSGLAGLMILAGGWATVWLVPALLDSPLLDKGPAWRPPDPVEQVITSYLAVLLIAPVLGALIGWLATIAVAGPAAPAEQSSRPVRGVRIAGVSGLAVAGLLVYPGMNAAAATDHTTFGQVGATSVVFSPAGGTLLTSNGDNTWILWNVADPTHPDRLATFNENVVYSPDGHALASRNVLWNLASSTRPRRTAQFAGGEPVTYSAGGTLLATHPTRATTTLWRVDDPRHPVRLGTLADGGDGVFTPDARTFIVGDDTTTTLWDVADPTRPARLAVLPGSSDRPLSPDGTTVATDTPAGIVLWDLTDRARPQRIGTLAGTTDPANPGYVSGRPVFSPNGHTVAVSNRDGAVTLFDTATGARTANLSPTPGSPNNNVQLGASNTLTTIAFTPDGRTLSVVTGNATVSIWNLTDPTRPVRTRILTRHTDGAGRIAFSPDGRTIAGAAVDAGNNITLWQLR
jgi:hypothetical protein